jgi:asparagine synthetase B (glutamine-hydrolysing)
MTVCAPDRTTPREAPSGAIPWLIEFSVDEHGTARLRGGHSADSGVLRVSFEGFLVDRRSLCASLNLGSDPHAWSDAELVLAAYRQWGLGAFGRLRGAFAAAVVDPANGVRTVARDPVGMHPLFYTTRGRHVLFASHPKTLIAQPGVSRDVNRAALADHLCWRWPDPQETFFAAVRRVLPGSRADLSRKGLTFHRYWNPAPDESAIDWLSTPGAIGFDERFDRAVDRCLEGGPAGIFLSGGLDSISVAAVATDRLHATGRPVPRALSLGFPGTACDERDTQTEVARTLGLPQDLVNFWETLGPDGLLRSGLELNRSLASPLLNTWGPAYLALARRGRTNKVTTILTGNGGDEWLTLTPYLSADLIRKGDLVGLASLLASAHRSYRASALRQGQSILWRFGLRPLIGRSLHRLAPVAWSSRRQRRAVRHDPPWVAPDRTLRSVQLDRATSSLAAADPPGGFYVREITEALRHPLVLWELEEQHEFGQQVGLRFMHPYWDADLIDVLFRSEPALLNAGGRSKGLVRQTLGRRFPALGLDRQRKLAGTSFFRSTAAREGPGALEAIGGDFPALRDLGVIESRAARDLVRASLDPSSPALKTALSLINLESWVRVQG